MVRSLIGTGIQNSPSLFCLQQVFAYDYCCELLGSGVYTQLGLWLRCHVWELSHSEESSTRVIHLQACHKQIATACDMSLDINTR